MDENKSLQLPPNLTVVENGRQVSQERIDPAVASFISQSVATANLIKLRKLEESKIPTGIKSLKYTISDTPLILRLNPPWISFSLVHATSCGLNLWINDEAEPAHKEVISAVDETFSLDCGYPIIKSIGLKAEESGSCEVRIIGKEGRRMD